MAFNNPLFVLVPPEADNDDTAVLSSDAEEPYLPTTLPEIAKLN